MTRSYWITPDALAAVRIALIAEARLIEILGDNIPYPGDYSPAFADSINWIGMQLDRHLHVLNIPSRRRGIPGEHLLLYALTLRSVRLGSVRWEYSYGCDCSGRVLTATLWTDSPCSEAYPVAAHDMLTLHKGRDLGI